MVSAVPSLKSERSALEGVQVGRQKPGDVGGREVELRVNPSGAQQCPPSVLVRPVTDMQDRIVRPGSRSRSDAGLGGGAVGGQTASAVSGIPGRGFHVCTYDSEGEPERLPSGSVNLLGNMGRAYYPAVGPARITQPTRHNRGRRGDNRDTEAWEGTSESGRRLVP